MKKNLRKLLAGVLALVMVFGCVGMAAAAEETGTPVLDLFADPFAHTDAKPMARHWYPDAGAGLTQAQIDAIKANPEIADEFQHDTEYLNLVAEQIRFLYEGGFGGVEMTMLADGAQYSSELAKYVAWGSEAWTRVLTQAMYTANELGEGAFKVDVTMTAHWPLIIDTIDPNDEAQQQQMFAVEQAVDPAALEGETLQLAMGEQRTKDYFSGFGADRSATFLFVDKLLATNIAVKNADGTLVFDSLTTLETEAFGGYAAGVPGTKYIVQAEDGHWIATDELPGEGVTYQETAYQDTFNIDIWDDVKNQYIDENGRAYMDDWQNLYRVSVADIQAYAEAHPLAEGQSYVIVNSYTQGTGQVCSGGEAVTMDNRNYAVNYYNQEGGKAVTDYWEANMLDLPVSVYDKDGNAVSTTLREQIQKNDGALFEDSLEMHTTKGTAWAKAVCDEAEAHIGYAIDKYLPLVNGYRVSGDNGQSSRISADISALQGDLYNEMHSAYISQWSKAQGFRGGYRFQSSSNLSRGVNVDIIESDNGTVGGRSFGLLKPSALVNLRGDQYHSMEGLTITTLDPFYYDTVLELNMNASRGVNRQIYHGTPFIQSAAGKINKWPGWSFNHGMSGYGTWSARLPLWENMDTLNDYVTRIQGLLQTADVKIPVMFIGGNGDSFSLLYDNGYHYNVAEECVFLQDYTAADYVVDGVLKPDGLATELIVIAGMNSVSDVAFLDRMNAYADKGMTIALYNSNITKVSGVETEINNDAAAAAAFAALQTKAVTVSSVEEILELAKTCTDNTIEYNSENVEVTHLVDEDETDYYYLFNYKGGDSISFGGVGSGVSLSNVNGEAATVDFVIDCADDETLYLLDAWNGEITELTDFVRNGDGTVSLTMDFAAWDTAVLAVSSNAEAFRAAGAEKVVKTEYAAGAIDLTDADWDLTIESWGPASDFDADAPFYATARKNIDVGTVKLGLWKDLEIPQEVFDAIGMTAEEIENAPAAGGGGFPGGPGGGPGGPPPGGFPGGDFPFPMALSLEADEPEEEEKETGSFYLSGIGYYTTTVNWEDGDGAFFYYDHRDDSKTGDAQVNSDMVTEIKVVAPSGKTTVISNLNQVSGKADLGDALEPGQNTITVKLTTTLRNRSKLEGYNNGGCSYTSYGLTAASIVPYQTAAKVALTGAAEGVMGDALTYQVSVSNAANLATASISLAVDEAAEVRGLNGFEILSTTYADGVRTVVLYNNAGVATNDAADLLEITLVAEDVGAVEVQLLDATLSIFVGDSGEAFLTTIVENDTVTTDVKYHICDVNRDGVVNQLDITRAQRFFGTADEVCDVDGNGAVNTADLIMILNNYTA